MFGCAQGVIRTTVGYTGGSKKNPSYHSMGNHSESLEIEWDPEQTTYEALLEMFWKGHSPTTPSCRQYMSGIWYHSEEQLSIIKKSMEAHKSQFARPIVTVIEPAGTFTPAEGYHQKFELRKDSKLMRAIKVSEEDMVNSHIASRLNGYVGGYGTLKTLEEEISSFGLDEHVADHLRKLVEGPSGKMYCRR